MDRYTISHWWKGFKARNIVAPDPSEPIQAADVFATPVKAPRVIMMSCERPIGLYRKGTRRREKVVLGWRVFAHNDGERAEVLVAWIRTLNREGSHA